MTVSKEMNYIHDTVLTNESMVGTCSLDGVAPHVVNTRDYVTV
jgi:hypothetical protein